MHSFALHNEEAVSNQPSCRCVLVLIDNDIADSEPVWRLILDHISLWWGEVFTEDHMPEGSDICLKRGTSEKSDFIFYCGYIHELFTLQSVYSTLGILGELWQSLLPCCEGKYSWGIPRNISEEVKYQQKVQKVWRERRKKEQNKRAGSKESELSRCVCAWKNPSTQVVKIHQI